MGTRKVVVGGPRPLRGQGVGGYPEWQRDRACGPSLPEPIGSWTVTCQASAQFKGTRLGCPGGGVEGQPAAAGARVRDDHPGYGVVSLPRRRGSTHGRA